MRKLVSIIILAVILVGLIVYKDQILSEFYNLGEKSKEKVGQLIDEEIKQPISDAVQKKIDETFEKVKESITGESASKDNFTAAEPLRFKSVEAPAKTELSKIEVFALTNVERVINGNLPVLLPNSKLDEIARLRLEDMFQKQYFEHVSPSGESASTEAKVVGYEYATIGENIALGNFGSDKKLVTAWMNSPGHRANILSTKFTQLGIAVKEGIYEGEKTWIAVQIFAKPISACPAVSQSLKAEIDNQKSQLAQLQTKADALKSEIENQDPKTKEEVRIYNQKVEQYNALAAQINVLIAETKVDIETYNTQINAFNVCIAG
ncbi:MAG: CAP domain-containing protein [Patescibacteria group bacterium]